MIGLTYELSDYFRFDFCKFVVRNFNFALPKSYKIEKMVEIDKSKPVLVTGATGYLAGWLVKKLLEEGCTVHAAVRDPERKDKTQHLDELAAESNGTIRYFATDLLKEGSYAEAMEGCELVFHTASPFISAFKDPQKDLVDPALKGTTNVLNQANKTSSVKRVVLTSSCAAIYNHADEVEKMPNGELNESFWNETSSLEDNPYSYSKTLAEKKAWELVKAQENWDLVVINPSFILGPFLNPAATTSESFHIMKQMGDGTFKQGSPRIGIGAVDVRDVALAHYKAGFTPSASGRNVTSGHNTNFLEMAALLRAHYGNKFPLPTKTVPKWLIWLLGPMLNKSLTRDFVKHNVNFAMKANNRKIKKELGMEFRPLSETLVDTFESMIDGGILTPKS